MALNAFLRLEGDIQGEIKGSVKQAGREDSIMVIASEQEIAAVFDQVSGLPTGKRQHRPFIITKEIDRSSPLLRKAFIENENLSNWKLEFWRPSPTGREEQYFTIELSNARIIDIKFEMPNSNIPETSQLKERENISFIYQGITWNYKPDNIMVEENWIVFNP